jgi:hypothetical protein
MNEAITSAVVIFRNLPQLDDESAFRALLKLGIERSLAARIVEFLPMAYCRVLFLNSGVQFSKGFTRAASPLKVQSLSLERAIGGYPVRATVNRRVVGSSPT